MPPERLILLCGEFNKNLKQIEKALKIKILQNGTEFDLSGKEDDVQIGGSALFDLKQKQKEANESNRHGIEHAS